MILFALAIGVATFIENDFGTPAAQHWIYKAKWFEYLMLLFAGSLIRNIFKFRLYKKGKWPIGLFHFSMIIIFIGAFTTRYFGYEGMMHIREGSQSNHIVSSNAYIQTYLNDGARTIKFENPVLFSGLGKNKFNKTLNTGKDKINLKLLKFIPNAVEELVESSEGKPIMHLVVADQMSGRRDIYLQQGERVLVNGYQLSFNGPVDGDKIIDFLYLNDSLLITPPDDLYRMSMGTQAVDTFPAMESQLFQSGFLFSLPDLNIVLKGFNKAADLEVVSTGKKIKAESINAVKMEIELNGQKEVITAFGNAGMQAEGVNFELGGYRGMLSYGSKNIILPFSLHLRDFEMERYPGSSSPASYASEVTLIDDAAGINRDVRVYMNHVLDYKGYRFFQSSYDQDELGTVLSVNHDKWGTNISYLGYFLLTLGMILVFFSKKSRFAFLVRQSKKYGEKAALIALMMMAVQWGFAQDQPDSTQVLTTFPVISTEHTDILAYMPIMDYKGRVKPFNTMASEVFRKISRKTSYRDQNTDQIVMGMVVFPEFWKYEPIIKVGHKGVNDKLNKQGSRLAYVDFFNENGEYLLLEDVKKAHQLKPGSRSKYDNELIKVDERVNISNMVYSGRLLRIFPKLDTTDTNWYTPVEALHAAPGEANELTKNFFGAYIQLVADAVSKGDWTHANKALEVLDVYQKEYGSKVIPSASKLNLEVKLNRSNVFSRLAGLYGLIGFIMLVLVFIRIIREGKGSKIPVNIGAVLLIGLFLIHTAGLIARWYVSGHAPWSNGYESMVYVAWATMLAGILFMRKATATIALTGILAATILGVAGMSWLDPEITPLVPVLSSYWLKIHVSLIVASYGFLALGALLGFINLLLMIINWKGTMQTAKRVIKQMTAISEMGMTVGLVMLSISTYLGGVWANESWGRYWGWDAKETWALVSILVYAFVVHMRLVPKLKDLFLFNFVSVIAYASILMTYFGVNYYLSGLHSYAAGDPVPIPSFVYYTVAIVFITGLLAYLSKGRKV